MNPDWNLDGRAVVNWRTCSWRPFPGGAGLAWHPVRDGSWPDNGFFLLNIPPGKSMPQFGAGVREEFVVLDGSLSDSDGLELVDGDFVSYRPGTFHRAGSPHGSTLLCYTAPASDREGGSLARTDARKVANWRTAAFEPYPGLPDSGRPLVWHDIRGNPATAEGFYIVHFPPGATSAAHEHIGYEEFVILDGSLTDSDGTTYRIDDCVSLPPGSIHSSHAVTGCVTASMINGPFRILVDDT